MKRIFCGIIAFVLIMQMQLSFADSIPYEWSNLPVGAHGFVSGMVMHPLEKDLIYIRTDVGGAYRWDNTSNSWIQLCDVFGKEEQNFYGIDGLAIDPQNPDVVYMAAGKYASVPGELFKSSDRGKTWIKTGLNKRFDANGGAMKAMGECIAVDPVNSSVVYCGTVQEGLWKSDDGALTWKQVNGFEIALDKKNQVRNIVFDSNTTSEGISKTIYAGVTNKGLYRSVDGGESWELLSGSPLTIRRMEIGKSGALYVASETGLFKLEKDTWTEISDASQKGKTHFAIAIDPTDENILMCVGYSSFRMRLPIYRSTNGGKTWVNVWDTARITSTLPWNQVYGDFSSGTSDIKIDPFNPNKVWLSDLYGVFMTEDITASPIQAWTDPVKGLEEVVPRDAISPPTGKYRLITAFADVDGFPYEDITQYPTRMIRKVRDKPWMMGTSQIDFCEEDPNIILRVGIDWNTNGKAEYSKENTEDWINITNLPHYVDANGNPSNAVPYGRAAVSSQKHPKTGCPAFVIVPAYRINDKQKLPEGMKTVPMVSLDMGSTWTQAKGFPDGTNIIDNYWAKHTPIASDRVNGSKFYVCTGDYVYVSEDWGLNWTQTAEIKGNPNSTVIRTAPNMEGEVWVGKGDAGIYRSSDSGKTFNKIEAVSNCVAFGFGKEAPGYKNPALYLYGTIDGVMGMYRSINMGKSWDMISNDANKLGCMPIGVVGDRRTFGLVYVGSDGRSFYVGKPEGTVLGGDIQINLNGESFKFENKPVINNGTLMIPIREFLNHFSSEMKWENDTLITEITTNNSGIVVSSKFSLGSSKMVVNGEEKTLSEAPYLINDKMYVPFEAAMEAVGVQEKWDENKQIYTINQ